MSGLPVPANGSQPPALFSDIEGRYVPFTLDATADQSNTKCMDYFTLEQDCLSQPWHGVVWCNPPYRDIRLVRRLEEFRSGRCRPRSTPASSQTSTAWFHDFACPLPSSIGSGVAHVRRQKDLPSCRVGGGVQVNPYTNGGGYHLSLCCRELAIEPSIHRCVLMDPRNGETYRWVGIAEFRACHRSPPLAQLPGPSGASARFGMFLDTAGDSIPTTLPKT